MHDIFTRHLKKVDCSMFLRVCSNILRRWNLRPTNHSRISHESRTNLKHSPPNPPRIPLESPTIPTQFPSNPPRIPLESPMNPPRIPLESHEILNYLIRFTLILGCWHSLSIGIGNFRLIREAQSRFRSGGT